MLRVPFGSPSRVVSEPDVHNPLMLQSRPVVGPCAETVVGRSWPSMKRIRKTARNFPTAPERSLAVRRPVFALAIDPPDLSAQQYPEAVEYSRVVGAGHVKAR